MTFDLFCCIIIDVPLIGRCINLKYAEVSEWFKEPVLKTGDSAMGRGFESHPLRSFFEKSLINLFRKTFGDVPKWLKGLPWKGSRS